MKRNLIVALLCSFAVAGQAAQVVNDPFTDGVRTNGTDTLDTAWYSLSGPGSILSIVNDSVTGGIGSGNAIRLAATSYRQGLVAHLPSEIALADGGTLRLSFKWRFTGTTNINQSGRLRFGLFHSGGTPTTADDGSSRSNDKGYWASTNPGSANATGTGLCEENTGDDLLGGTGTVGIGTSGASINGGTTMHEATLLITRSGNSLAISGSIDGQTAATATVSAPITTSFDSVAISIGIGNYTTPSPLLIDDLIVDHTGGSLLNLSNAHDFAVPGNIGASASTQFTGLTSLTDYRATPSADRYVYSFETWPETVNQLGLNEYTFRFDLDGNGSSDQQVNLRRLAGFTLPQLTKGTNSSASSPSTYLGGLGEIGYNGNNGTTHVFTFQKPVGGFGVVYRSPANVRLFKSNDYPISYTLSDGTVVTMGGSGVEAAVFQANTNTFVGLTDSTGKGIVSVTIRLRGTLTSASQQVFMDDLSFLDLPEPAVSSIANLNARHDFPNPTAISASASTQLAGLSSLDQFRALAPGNRHVYTFSSWPQAAASLGVNSYAFRFDLNGNGAEDQRVTIGYSGTYSGSTVLTKGSQTDASSPSSVLDGMGNVAGTAYAEHSFTFQQPVSAAGFVYRSTADLNLQRTGGFPVSYTLTDGTVVNLGLSGGVGAVLPANTNSFVGVIDNSGKGITSMTVRVQGTAASNQAVYIDDLAFVLAGPPTGDWTLVLNEEFNGTTLNPAIWSKGYRWADVINNELQAHRPENVNVANGVCTITVERRPGSRMMDMNGYQWGSFNYASGAIQTYNKFTQKYGYFEARLKMPNATGTWPAFWLLPDRGASYTDLDERVAVGNSTGGVSIPMGNELDVVEFMSAWKDANGLFASHSGYFWNYSGGNWGDYAKTNDGTGSRYYFPNADTEFHTYGMYWAPGKVIFYIDGRVVLKREDPSGIAVCPEYLILNCAISTNCWVRTATIAEIDADLATPKYMEIDYVKVWADNTIPQ